MFPGWKMVERLAHLRNEINTQVARENLVTTTARRQYQTPLNGKSRSFLSIDT